MLLSICIPSFNRLDNLKRIIDSILKAKSKQFEIVVLDNNSSEDIVKNVVYMDERVRIIKRDTNVGGIKNVRECLESGRGKYVMLCLDKDYIDGDELDKFLYELNNTTDLYGGLCTLNKKDEKSAVHIISENPLYTFEYRGRHPSGMFFRRSVVELDKEKIHKDDIYNPFAVSMILARCSTLGKMMIYDFPLVFTENEMEAAEKKSFSYDGNIDEIFFGPKKRKEQLKIYLRHLATLDILEEEYKYIVKRLCFQVMMECTIDFRGIMKNQNICTHYGLKKRDVTKEELRKEAKGYIRFFMKEPIKDVTIAFKLQCLLHATRYLKKRI